MKKILSSLLLAAFAVLAVPASYAQAENVFRVGMATDPESLDPYMQLSGPMLAYAHWVFDPLIRWTQEGTFEPRLAEKWEQVDPLTTRFYLRKDVKFHSGNPLTSEDVVWTFNRMLNSVDYKGLYEGFSATAIDDYTVDIKTKEPYSLVPHVATYIFVMDSKFYSGTDDKGKPKDQISKTDYSFANENASGTGPFKVVLREAGVRLILEKNPAYWGKSGNVDKLELSVIAEGATRVAGILAGNVDFITPVPVQDYEQLEKKDNVELITMPSTRILVIQMNGKRNPALADHRVREALIRGTDNKGIAEKIMRNYTTPIYQQAVEGMAGYDPALGSRYDVEKAKALLAEAGYANGLELSMITTNDRYVNDEKVAQAFVAMMARIGVKVNLRSFPKSQYWDEYDSQVADLQLVGWHPDTEDSVNFGEYLLMCPNPETGKGQYNSGNWCNPEFDQIQIAANRETDPVKRDEMLKKSEKMAYDDAAQITLHREPLSWAAGPRVTNAKAIVNGMDFPYFGEIVMK